MRTGVAFPDEERRREVEGMRRGIKGKRMDEAWDEEGREGRLTGGGAGEQLPPRE